MLTTAVLQEVRSPSWAAAQPAVCVVIATHQRAPFLRELLTALEQLRPVPGGMEVIVVDDGSTDGTWPLLEELTQTTSLALLVLRVAATGGPSLPRNTGVARGRAKLLAFTDDDCLPRPEWLAALAATAGEGVVQGKTLPTAGGPSGPWDRTITVAKLTALYETCNLALPRQLFLEVGGFPVLAQGPRGFGEDVALGHRAAERSGVRFCADAVVEHRWLAATYRQHLDGRRRLAGFPALTRQLPTLRARLLLRLFLSRRSAACDVAAVGLLGAAAGRRGWLLAALPWLLLVLQEAGRRPGRPLPVRMAQVALADAVATASLLEGSVRTRTPVL